MLHLRNILMQHTCLTSSILYFFIYFSDNTVIYNKLKVIFTPIRSSAQIFNIHISKQEIRKNKLTQAAIEKVTLN